MISTLRSTRSIRSLLLLSICLLIATLVLPHPVQAISVSLTVDDTLSEFTRGNFQRTALGALQVASNDFPDQEGAVQLAPLGLLKDWSESPFDLPEALIGMGVTAIGNRIYVIGGETFDSGETIRRANVWSGAIDTETGALIAPGWEAEPALPAVQNSLQAPFDEENPIAEIYRPAVTSVENPGGGGYIYVIGGSVKSGTLDVSSFAVRIGTVGANGRITGWQEGPPIPSPDANPFNQNGLRDAAVVSLNIDGTHYIYLLGGLRQYLEGTGSGGANTVSSPSKKVFYARVGSDGNLLKPSNGEPGWDDAEADIPVPGNGIWGAVAVGNRFVASNNAYAIYLTGGQLSTEPLEISSRTYLATVGSDGKPTWDSEQFTLPTGRSNHAGVEFRGNLYLTGGQPGGSNEPDRKVLTSYVEDDLTLPQFGDPGSNFLPNDTLPKPRTLHGSVVVATEEGTAFVYVIGGRGDTTDGDPTDDQGTDIVIYGKVGGIEEIAGTDYAPTAWYYSQPYTIIFDQAQVQKVSWSTLMTQTGGIDMDIALDYRTANANDCNEAGWTDEDWQPLDGTTDSHRSQSGRNEVDVGNPQARCFQYRARLSTGNVTFTPSLLNVSIQIVIPGSPDLKPVDLADKRGGEGNRQLTGIDVFVLNENQFEETLAADIESPGDFYVDICIFPPGGTPQPPTIPISDDGCTKVYAKVSKSVMGVGAKYKVREWLDFETDELMSTEKFNSLFPVVGVYTIYVAVDSTDFVNEGTRGGENNNIAELQVEVFADPTDPTGQKPYVDISLESPGLLLPIIGQ